MTPNAGIAERRGDDRMQGKCFGQPKRRGSGDMLRQLPQAPGHIFQDETMRLLLCEVCIKWQERLDLQGSNQCSNAHIVILHPKRIPILFCMSRKNMAQNYEENHDSSGFDACMDLPYCLVFCTNLTFVWHPARLTHDIKINNYCSFIQWKKDPG